MDTLNRRNGAGAFALALALALGWGAVALAGSKVPPSIDDLDNAVCAMKVKGTAADLDGGAIEKVKDAFTWTIVKTGPDTVTIHDDSKGETYNGYYYKGMLTIGTVNSAELATEARCGYIVVSGKPGKLKLKGEFVQFDASTDNEMAYGKVSGKQTQ